MSATDCLEWVQQDRHIDTSPTARMRLFTVTLVCLLIQVVQKNCGVHGARWLGHAGPSKCQRQSPLLSSCSISSTRKAMQFRPHLVRFQLSEKFGECALGNFGKTINSSQSKTCEQNPITPDKLEQFLQELFPYRT